MEINKDTTCGKYHIPLMQYWGEIFKTTEISKLEELEDKFNAIIVSLENINEEESSDTILALNSMVFYIRGKKAGIRQIKQESN